MLQQRQKERDEAERKFLNRAMQQTAVAAVGQCALTNRDLSVIYEQAVYRVAEMFAVEYAMLFQRLPDGQLYPLAVYGLAPKIVGEGATRQNKPSQMSWTAETGEGCRLMAEPAVPVFSTSFRPELMLGAANAMVPPE